MTELERIESIADEKARNFIKLLYANRPEDIPENPDKNKWYTYRPENAVCSDGEPYYSIMRIGPENKLMVLFCGGGVALDAFSAARPNSLNPSEEPTFYTGNTAVMGYFYGKSGIASNDKENNPFKNWSVVIVQYATGDFHCGTNSFEYDDAELGKGVCQHKGYMNYRAMLDKVCEYVPNPEKVVVTGFSAGGFGTALLTDDVMETFKECEDFTCLVDSAVFTYKGWHETAEKQWKAPEKICKKLVSDDLTLDCLLDLHKKYGNRVKIAFICTYRDALLAQMQNYTDGRDFVFDKEGGDNFQKVLKNFTEKLCSSVPEASVYLFDKPNAEVKDGNLTDHTIIVTDNVFEYSYKGHMLIDWIEAVISGKTQRIGLELVGL